MRGYLVKFLVDGAWEMFGISFLEAYEVKDERIRMSRFEINVLDVARELLHFQKYTDITPPVYILDRYSHSVLAYVSRREGQHYLEAWISDNDFEPPMRTASLPLNVSLEIGVGISALIVHRALFEYSPPIAKNLAEYLLHMRAWSDF